MWKFLKRPSILAGIFGLVLAVAALVPGLLPLIEGHALTDATKQLEVIAGFLVLWLTCILIVILQQIEMTNDVEKTINRESIDVLKAYQNLCAILKVNPDLLRDETLNKKVEKIVKLWKATESRVYARKEIEERFDDLLEKGAQVTHGFLHLSFKKEKELDRMSKLKLIVENAGRYVYAVTLDEGEYLEDFYSGEFFDEYIEANNKKTSNGKVTIKRFFIVDREVINDQDQAKRNKLEQIIRRHKLQNSRLDVHIVCKDKLPKNLKDCHTSFLVCDDSVASESYSLHDEGKTDGYVVYYDKKRCIELNRRFKLLESVPDENWIKRRSNRQVV